MQHLRSVAVLIETSREYGRALLRGVARWLQEHEPWSIYFCPHDLDRRPPLWLKRWRGDGILVRVNSGRMAKAVRDTGLPAIDLRGALPDAQLPFIGVDNRRVVQLAFDHLSRRGFRQFGFCAAPRRQNCLLDLRCELFQQLVRNAGHACAVFLPRGPRQRLADWELQQQKVAHWIHALPKPIGIMACHDDIGQQVLDACLRGGVRVPEEVAVVSVDNDEHLCGLSNPPLTSVDTGADAIGYEAAALLDRLMSGASPPRGGIELPPRELVVRRSSETWAVDDPEVVRAAKVILDRACDGLSVRQVVAAGNLSRSTLERRFKELIGHTPKVEILRVQLERARQLLAHTSLSQEEIAAKCGFNSAPYFCDAFRRAASETPGAYRTRMQERR